MVSLLLPPEVWLSEDALYSRNGLVAVTQADSLVPKEYIFLVTIPLFFISRRLQVLTLWELINSIELAVDGFSSRVGSFYCDYSAFPR